MIEKGTVDIGDMKVRLFIDPYEPEYLQFSIYDCEENNMTISDALANEILSQALELIQVIF